ncbi:MAG: STAS domain-containing protein [Planctomycetaceae bacterium]|nr:STAS domain-containing protein [Planctomycetaceae bacterium]
MSNPRGFESTFFRIEDESGCVIVVMTRLQLTEEENLEQMDEDFRALVERFSLRKVVVNLVNVEYLTSSAVGKLISWHRHMIRQDGQLVLSELREQVTAILDTSHLLSYFQVCDTTSAAVAQLLE